MKRFQRGLLGAVTVLVLMVAPLLATPPESVTGGFAVTSQTLTSVRPAGPNTIITGMNTITVTGDVSGSATFEFRQVNHGDGSFNSNGIFTCVCTIDGRSGTFVMRVTGTGSLGPPLTFSGVAVVLSADGGLDGLHGYFVFSQLGATGTYEGRIHFD